MTESAFLHQVRRGIGSAILELKNNPERLRYREALLRCCLKNISYDLQCEGTKGHYLYTAINSMGLKDEFEEILIRHFEKRLEYALFVQLMSLLWMYADDGSLVARRALHNKYQSLLIRLSRQKKCSNRYREREQFGQLIVCEVETDRWPAFEKGVFDLGHIVLAQGSTACMDCDWFLSAARDLFGEKRVARYLQSAAEKHPEVGAFVAYIEARENSARENARSEKKEPLSLQSYLATVQATEREADPHARVRKKIAAMKFARQASAEDRLALATLIVAEPSDEVRADWLQVFERADFPMDIALLIAFTESHCKRLQESALKALRRFKDGRVRDLALHFLTQDNVEAGVSLLLNNWRKKDDALIRERTVSRKKIAHALQSLVRDLYQKHRSATCGAVLEHVYRNGDCAYCRWGIVEVLWKNRVLREEILNECLYDSYDDTRALAERVVRLVSKRQENKLSTR